MKIKYTLLLTFLICACSQQKSDSLLDEGVSWELAEHRKANIDSLCYRLLFRIPEEKSADVEGEETINLHLENIQEVILDFREEADKLHSIEVNEKKCPIDLQNEHIIIPQSLTRKGKNNIRICFTAGNQSLNRRDGYVYTLFVPDRARTVFPCMDQPNMKARFSLELDIPIAWTAVTNSAATDTIAKEDGRKLIRFGTTEPLPTYLFAFAAGEFQRVEYEEDDHRIGIYHRETDEKRLSQLCDIGRQVTFSLRWLEDFTGVPYPFSKYDLVILPGFQFGGMEHTGATFYNDNTIFLPQNPTPDEQLRRTELISHETAHMWFGDAVTMNWFDDVWTKEVFANYFAAEITTPQFPDINHDLNWLKTYVTAAISQDRTEGRTSIRQPLDNMRYAGLIYNAIIYNKAPVMMRRMVELMGKKAFRRGIQKYLKEYLYGNATWDDLIAILDSETDADLKAFSKEWVDEAHWPKYKAETAQDPRIGKEYGYFELSQEQCNRLLHTWQKEKDGKRRQALLMTLYENYLNNNIGDVPFMHALVEALKTETNPLTSLTIISYMSEPMEGAFHCGETFEEELLQLSHVHPLPAVRTQLLRLLRSKARTQKVIDALYQIWSEASSPLLSENDYMTLAYELAIRLPEKADSIITAQHNRLTNPDRQAQFAFISRAVSPSEEACDTLFKSLKEPKNRRIEPWVLSVLYYLNHPLRQQRAVKYISPALELLPEIQRTGDIFFPGNWCSNLLAGHRSREAYNEVEHFLQTHQEYPELLKNKIKYAKYHLDRNNEPLTDKK